MDPLKAQHDGTGIGFFHQFARGTARCGRRPPRS
jgi:hypothetical protein